MIGSRLIGALLASAVALFGGCQSTAAPRPAVLERGDVETMTQLKTGLARAMGRARIELGPSDPTQSPNLTVLPPAPSPLEDRNTALPTVFRLELEGGRCFAVREDTGERYTLDGVACRPL